MAMRLVFRKKNVARLSWLIATVRQTERPTLLIQGRIPLKSNRSTRDEDTGRARLSLHPCDPYGSGIPTLEVGCDVRGKEDGIPFLAERLLVLVAPGWLPPWQVLGERFATSVTDEQLHPGTIVPNDEFGATGDGTPAVHQMVKDYDDPTLQVASDSLLTFLLQRRIPGDTLQRLESAVRALHR